MRGIAVYTADAAGSIKEGIEKAAQSHRFGLAAKKLRQLVEYSNK